MKLPKQWPRWLEKAGLSADRRYLDMPNGRNRNWRVDASGNFECSCPLEYFDRWANSRGAAMVGIPATEADFIRTVNLLIEKSKDAR